VDRALEDVTRQLIGELSENLAVQLELLPKLRNLFGEATASAALGELSELLVMQFTGAQRPARRNNPGYDLELGEETIEVKSRDISEWNEALKFDFRSGSANTTTAFCIVWKWDGNTPKIEQAFRAPVRFLIDKWGSKQKGYSVRTSLRWLRSELEAGSFPPL
jgi:hypothetical protein